MAILNQKRILNLIPKVSAPVTLHVSQGDVGTEIEFTLVKGDEVFVNPGNVTASVHGVREDGANFGPFTCTLSGSSVSFPLHSEMTVVKGSAIAEVVLVDDDSNKVGSANFGILVEESVFPLGVTYDNDVSVYESILAYVQTIPAQVEADITAAVAQETSARVAGDAALNTALGTTNSNLSGEISARESADALINTRIDEIIAPSGEAPNPSEIVDARIGEGDVTYATLGKAIRTQIEHIQRGLQVVGTATIADEYIDTNGDFVSYNGWSRSDYIPVNEGDKIYYDTTRTTPYCAFYDANHTFMNTTQLNSGGGNKIVPVGAKYFAFSNKDPESATTYIYTLSNMEKNGLHSDAITPIRLNGTDIFTLPTGDYIYVGGTDTPPINAPINTRFRLHIIATSTTNYIGIIYANDAIYINHTLSGVWQTWHKLLNVNDPVNIFDISNSIQISDGTDLFTLDIGSYISSAVNLVHSPTTVSFRLFIYNRTTSSNKLAYLIDTNNNIYTNAYYSNTWHDWHLISAMTPIDENWIPEYYRDYIVNQCAAINNYENLYPNNTDSFIFITDFHYPRNEKHSPALIKYIVEHTGITKMFFGGDAYRTDTNDRAATQQNITLVYSWLDKLVKYFYPVVGNHEWNHLQGASNENLQRDYENSVSGVYNYCVKRAENYVENLSDEGNYYYDNKAKKIRYICLQYNGDARPTPSTLTYLGNLLESTPNDYYVLVICHYAPMSTHAAPSLTSYDGRGSYFPKLVADMLQAYNTASTFSYNASYTANDVTMTYTGNFDFTNHSSNMVIGILAGHWHEDDAIQKTASNILQVLVTCDQNKNGDGTYITYVEDGETLERTSGTIREQAFDIVHIDTTNRKMYLRRIGGGSNRVFDF